MRRLMALALLAPLVLIAGPARAEPVVRHPVHGFDPQYWPLVSFDCAGAPADGAAFTMPRVPGAPAGTGVLHVDAPEGMGGVLVHANPRHLTGWYARAIARSGDAPTLVWRVEFNEHVFTGDPEELSTDSWLGTTLRDTRLHEGEWSGTIYQAINQFGPAEDPLVGVLTGGCLGSDVADVDVLGSGWDYYDFEPSRWVELVDPGGYGSSVEPGQRFRLDAQVMDTTVTTGVDRPIRNALVNLKRKLEGQHTWKLVDSARTGKDGSIVFRETAPRKDATYRAVWRDTNGKIAGTDPASVGVR